MASEALIIPTVHGAEVSAPARDGSTKGAVVCVL